MHLTNHNAYCCNYVNRMSHSLVTSVQFFCDVMMSLWLSPGIERIVWPCHGRGWWIDSDGFIYCLEEAMATDVAFNCPLLSGTTASAEFDFGGVGGLYCTVVIHATLCEGHIDVWISPKLTLWRHCREFSPQSVVNNICFVTSIVTILKERTVEGLCAVSMPFEFKGHFLMR